MWRLRNDLATSPSAAENKDTPVQVLANGHFGSALCKVSAALHGL